MDNSYWISGIHAVQAALNNKERDVLEIIVLEENLNKLLNANKIKISVQNKKFFNKIFKSEDKNFTHQGVAAKIRPLLKKNLENLLQDNNLNTVVFLDQINDPRNIGSIIRNCVAFNIKYLILENNSVNLKSNAMHKASSGYIENISIIEVSNINNALIKLKKENFFIYGMDSNGGRELGSVNFVKKKIIILGSEGKGIRKNVSEKCNQLIKIKMNKETESLNVSNASAIILHHIANLSY